MLFCLLSFCFVLIYLKFVLTLNYVGLLAIRESKEMVVEAVTENGVVDETVTGTGVTSLCCHVKVKIKIESNRVDLLS